MTATAPTVQSIRKANTISCRCHRCRSGCEMRPGFFLPGQAAETARRIGLTPQEFFDRFLVVDWIEAAALRWRGIPIKPDNTPFALAPAIEGDATGGETQSTAAGRCIFWNPDGGACRIHEAKPFECREGDHDDSNDFIRRRATAIMGAWESPEAREEIREMLGREPSKEPR